MAQYVPIESSDLEFTAEIVDGVMPVSGPYTDLWVYSWKQVYRNQSTGEYVDAPGGKFGRYLDPSEPGGEKVGVPALELNNREVPAGTIVRMRQIITRGVVGYEFDAGLAGEEVGTGPVSASDWKPYRITGRTPAVRPPAPPPHFPPIYSGVEIELVTDSNGILAGNQLGWIDVVGGDSFSQGIRMPSRDIDENYDSELLLAIPVGQTVFARPSPTLAGYYEIAPWGGTRSTSIEHLYRVCTQCVEVSPGVFKFRTKMAIRMITEIARDRRAMIGASDDGEENLEDNSDGSIT